MYIYIYMHRRIDDKQQLYQKLRNNSRQRELSLEFKDHQHLFFTTKIFQITKYEHLLPSQTTETNLTVVPIFRLDVKVKRREFRNKLNELHENYD